MSVEEPSGLLVILLPTLFVIGLSLAKFRRNKA